MTEPLSQDELEAARRLLSTTHATGQAVVLARVGAQLLAEVGRLQAAEQENARLREAIEKHECVTTHPDHDPHPGTGRHTHVGNEKALRIALKGEETPDAE